MMTRSYGTVGRLSAMLMSLILRVERLNKLPPGPLNHALYRLHALLARVSAPFAPRAGSADDWMCPLVAGRAAERGSPAGEERSQDTGKVPHRNVGIDTGRLTFRATERTRLHCLILTDVLDVGGLQEVVAFLARQLPAHGVRTSVGYSRSQSVGIGQSAPSGRLARRLVEDGVPVMQVSDQDGTAWMAAQDPDVISAHMAPSWTLDAAEALDIPFVETIHNSVLELDSQEERSREEVRSRRVAGFVAVSDLARRLYLARNPSFPPHCIVTIPNAVDGERMALEDRGQSRHWLGLRDEFLFVCLARYAVQKNVFGLVAAFADVAAASLGAHLLIAGRVDDPLYYGQVHRLRNRLPCASRIHLRDHHQQPSRVLAAADAFVLDSFFEGWPLVSMEALCAGLPVIMSEVGGAREQVGDNGKRGYLVPNPLGDPALVGRRATRAARYGSQRNRASLVEAMVAVFHERERWSAAREHLGAESARRFHPDGCLRSYVDVLSRAAAAVPIGAFLRPIEPAVSD